MLTNLFTGLREHAIASGGIETANRLIPFEALQSLRSCEGTGLNFAEALEETWSAYFSKILEFPDPYREFANTKNCTAGKSYACKSTCISTKRNCLNPLPGQAQNYAAFLAMQSGSGGSTGGAGGTTATATATRTLGRPSSSVSGRKKGSAASASSPPATTPRAKKALSPPVPSTPSSPPIQSPVPSPQSPIKTNAKELKNKRDYLVKQFGQKTVEAAEKNVQKIFNDPDTNVFVRVGSTATLELILGDRFKTSAELGIDTHQIPFLKGGYQKARNRVEAKTLGYDEKTTNPDERPIYGYFGGKNLKGTSHADVSQAYGSIAVKLKPEVKDRATFTGADSFKSGIASEAVNAGTPPPPSAASLVSSTRHGYDKDKLPAGYPSSYADKSGDGRQLTSAVSAKSIDDLAPALSPTGNAYVEAQIHGKVGPQDIAEIHFEPRGGGDRPSAKVAQFAKDNGIDLYVKGKKLSTQDIDDLINPPKPPAPANDNRSQRLKDLSDAVSQGDFNKVLKLTETIDKDSQRVNLAPGEKDNVLKYLYQESGYDAKPQVVSKSDIDKASKDGATLMCRGVGAGTSNRTEYLDQFQNGDYFTGNGIYGNGTYVGHSGNISQGKFQPGSDATGAKRAWDGVAKHMYITPNSVNMRMALPKDAKVITATEQSKEIKSVKAKIKAWAQAERRKIQSANKYTQADIAKVDAEAQNVEASYASKVGKPKKKLVTKGLSLKEYQINIPVKGESDIAFKIREDADFFGRKQYSYTTSGGDTQTFRTQKAAIEAGTKEFYQTKAAKNLGYSEIPTITNTPKVAKELQEFNLKVSRMEEVLYGDEGNGTSGRFGVIQGVDAIALNNSYEPKVFMNLLNRGKVLIQKDELSYKDGDTKGLRP